MDAIKYIKEINRAEKNMEEWESLHIAENENPEKAVEIVEQWAKDHPRKTSEDRICPLLQCKCIKEKCEFYIESGCVAEHIFNLAVTMAKMG